MTPKIVNMRYGMSRATNLIRPTRERSCGGLETLGATEHERCLASEAMAWLQLTQSEPRALEAPHDETTTCVCVDLFRDYIQLPASIGFEGAT